MEAWRAAFLEQCREDSEEKISRTQQRKVKLLKGLFSTIPSPSWQITAQGHFMLRRMEKNRNRGRGEQIMYQDYFAENPTFSDRDFRRRYRMTRRLFLRILGDISTHDAYFKQKYDAANRRGLSGMQKVTSALRQIAYGIGADATDEYCRLGDTTGRESLYRFCTVVRRIYGPVYLRQPTQAICREFLPSMQNVDSQECLQVSIACTILGKNCPKGWQGQFGGKAGHNTVILEAVADYETWIWHAFFGLPGSNNDLNVLQVSPLVNNIIHDKYNSNTFELNGVTFSGAYLLVDGIYPKWACFMWSIAQPDSEKTKLFAKMQESFRKDVERAFGILQSQWGIVKQPARSWHLARVVDILYCCVILHNMVIEDERGENLEELAPGTSFPPLRRSTMPWRDYLQAVKGMETKDADFRLQNALMDHVWEQQGRRQSHHA